MSSKKKNRNKKAPANKKVDEFDVIFSDERSPEKEQIKNAYKQTAAANVFDWVEILALSAAFVLLMFTFLFRLAVVDGESMETTLQNGQLLFISDVGYEPKTGDIVVIYNDEKPLVKRVIATEGQTIKIDFDNWKIYVDGNEIDEREYINRKSDPMTEPRNDPEFSAQLREGYTVPEGKVFVLGDNRNFSKDSREIGCIDKRLILGDVKFRITPLSKFGSVD